MKSHPVKRDELRQLVSRRWFLRDAGVGLGSFAMLSLLGRGSAAASKALPQNPLAPKHSPYAARAKRVIYIFQAGAPSHLDLFDFKPELAKRTGKLPPPELLKDYRAAFINPNSKLLGPKFKFAKYGKAGAEISEMLPHLTKVVDDVCFIKSMHTDAFNHAPGQIFMNTGSQQFGRPSLGAWTIYGLGSASQNLPAFVVMSTGAGISGGSANWSSGFLPSSYAGVRFRNQGDPILNVSTPKGVDSKLQR